jgi:hypothetical protein
VHPPELVHAIPIISVETDSELLGISVREVERMRAQALALAQSGFEMFAELVHAARIGFEK